MQLLRAVLRDGSSSNEKTLPTSGLAEFFCSRFVDSAAHGGRDAERVHACGDLVETLAGRLEEVLARRLPVERVDRHESGADLPEGVEPGADVLVPVLSTLRPSHSPFMNIVWMMQRPSKAFMRSMSFGRS